MFEAIVASERSNSPFCSISSTCAFEMHSSIRLSGWFLVRNVASGCVSSRVATKSFTSPITGSSNLSLCSTNRLLSLVFTDSRAWSTCTLLRYSSNLSIHVFSVRRGARGKNWSVSTNVSISPLSSRSGGDSHGWLSCSAMVINFLMIQSTWGIAVSGYSPVNFSSSPLAISSGLTD